MEKKTPMVVSGRRAAAVTRVLHVLTPNMW
jgi:hypothetical protein